MSKSISKFGLKSNLKKSLILSVACLSLASIPISTKAQSNNLNPANVANLLASAASQTTNSSPQVDNVIVKENGPNPIIEISGKGFGKDGRAVMVLINDSGLFANVLSVRKKKVLAQLPNNVLCSGNVSVRVLVNKVASNAASFNYQKQSPILYQLSPTHAQPGSVIELQADNLACDVGANSVSFNNVPLTVIGGTSNSLQVRLPSNLASSSGAIKISVLGQDSNIKPFTVDNTQSNSPTPTEDKFLRFSNSTGVSAGFSPMFNITETIKGFPGAANSEVKLWDTMFYGTHQAIIDLPWTVEGIPQRALLTINCREANNMFGNFSGEKERFIYALISFPRDPEKLYHPDINPFFWGACAVATESSPSGNFIFNSLSRAGGGVDSFEISKDATTSGKATMTFRVIAPDLGYYEPYGINYAAAGNGVVKLPKVATVTVEMQQIDPNLPASYFRIGKVTFSDFANGTRVSEQVPFANTFSITDVPDFGLGMFR